MSKKNKVITFLVILLLCIIYVIKAIDYNDTFYLIKLGGDILKRGIDYKDHYSWINNLSYTYPHWLYCIYIYLIYKFFGFFGIYINNIIILLFLVFIIYNINKKLTNNNSLSILISIFSVPLLFPFIVARAQSISIILFLLEVLFINRLFDSGKKKYILFLLLISILIANIHATIWIMCLILFLPFLIETLIYKILSTKNKRLDSLFFNNIEIEKCNYSKYILIAFILCIVGGLFSPSKICYTYVLKTMLGDSQSYIIEHAKLVPIEHPFFLITISLLYFTRTKIKLREMIMIAGIVVMSLLSLRHLIFFYTIGLLYISILVSRYLSIKKEYTLDIVINAFYKKRIIYYSVIIILFLGAFVKVIINSRIDYIDDSVYPISATKYIKENLDYKNLKIYNEYDIGSYLLFNDIPVMIDSRCDLYFKEFNGKFDIFDDVMNIENNYQHVFDKYKVEYVLIKKNNILNKLLEIDANYNKIYNDKNFVIYDKDDKNEET